MHKKQAELILNISVTGGELCGFNHTVSSWRASVVGGGRQTGSGKRKGEEVSTWLEFPWFAMQEGKQVSAINSGIVSQ